MKNYHKIILASAALIAAATSSYSADTQTTSTAKAVETKTEKETQAAPKEKGAPLPLHTIEGYGGVLITPIAYLVNPNPNGDIGLPSVSVTYVNARQKNVTSLSVTETLYGRVELGFAASRFGTGSLESQVLGATGIDIGSNDVWLYNFNARTLILKENDFDTNWVPALTFAVQGKYNGNIQDISNALAAAGVPQGLGYIGYGRDYGVDFVLTASKAFDIYGHPLIFSVGGRASDAAQLGYLGFGGGYNVTVEGNVVFGVTNWLLLAFEYRQKPNPYNQNLSPLIGGENDWWTIGAAFILDKHTTLTAGYGHFGQVLNTQENAAWAVALKYEF